MHKSPPTVFTSFYTPRSLRRKSSWFINLRWIATVGMCILLFIASKLLDNGIPLKSLIWTLFILGISNAVYTLISIKLTPKSLITEMKFIRIQIYLDLILLSILIHFTGGIENPFFLFYIFHVIIASTIFEESRDAYSVAFFSVCIFTLIVWLESNETITHYNLFGSPLSTLSILISMSAFYITMFSSAYLGVTLIRRHQKVKNIISKQNIVIQDASHVKTKFFRFVSHELKSPIVAIQSSINVVLDILGKDLNSKTTKILTRAKKRSEQMLLIIKDLLDMTYDRQSDKAEREKVNPCDYLHEFIDNEKPHADEVGITIKKDICSERGSLRLEKFILEKIFSNLLSNAIRYTPKGGMVAITTTLTKINWEFTIIDNGIGISNEDQKHIFEEFYRTANAKKHVAVGTGLGLNIVKNLVDQLNGEISVKSKIDHGTTFTVTIPL